MKYISRIDQVTVDGRENHCWIVRIMIGTPYQIYKTFTDGRYLNKGDSLKAAIKFRDKMLKKYKKVVAAYKAKVLLSLIERAANSKLNILPRLIGRGYSFKQHKNKKKYVQARIRDRYEDCHLYKNFNYDSKESKEKAIKGALKWRRVEIKRILSTGRNLGFQ